MTTTAFFIPHSVEEALSLLGDHGPELLVMGGGTIVMNMVNDGQLFPRQVMSLRHAGMDEVRQANRHVEIGATTTIARISQLEAIPMLAHAAQVFGGPAIRNMATIGGNLFARQPAGDLAVPLLALDAEAEFANASSRHRMPLGKFLQGDSVRAEDELLVGIHIPVGQGRSTYMRLGRREANTPSIAAVAVRVITDKGGKCSEARIAIGAAGPHAMRATQAEDVLVGKPFDATSIAAAAQAAMDECDPFTDALATDWYRRKMVGVYVRRALEQALN